MTKFEDLDARKLAREVTQAVYRISQGKYFARDFALKDQICRSSLSIVANIAEGFEHDSNKEFVNFLSIAEASSVEAKPHLCIALDQNFISPVEFATLYKRCSQTGNVVAGLIKYLDQKEIKGLRFR